jgi:6-pyruvoyltetrahydropterin/6-carboxytetrahydropterin synthase
LKFTLSSRFQFDAAHTLDRSDSSLRVHGHTYFAEVAVAGEPGRDGMVMDLGHLDTMLQVIRGRIDHTLLNDVPGLGAPTIESLARYVFETAVGFGAAVRSVRVWRADGGACLVEATGSTKP